jgi:hypothetical protein
MTSGTAGSGSVSSPPPSGRGWQMKGGGLWCLAQGSAVRELRRCRAAMVNDPKDIRL